jgi:hypothetical protein
MSVPRVYIPPLERLPSLDGLSTYNSLPCDYLPEVASPSSIEWDEHDVVAQSISPFTGQTQTYDWQSAWWEAQVSFPPMSRFSHDAWSAFLSRLRGPLGVFLIGDPKARVPKGTARVAGEGSTGPVVDGAGQSGYQVATRGWVANQPMLFLPGDYISIAGIRLYKLTDAASSDATGKAVLSIWPPLRDNPADGTTLTTRNCKGLFRLKAASGNKHSTNVGLYGFSGFAIREAIDINGDTGILAGGGSGGSGGSGGGTTPPIALAAVTSWFNETGSSNTQLMANGPVGTVSLAGAAPVAIPAFAYETGVPSVFACTYYAFFCLGQDLVWRSYWSSTRADSTLVGARIAAGDLIYLAQWIFAPQGPYGIVSYVGGGVGEFLG